MAETDLTITVSTGREHRPVDGGDSVIFVLPPGHYVDVGDGKPALDLGPFMHMIRSIAEAAASNLNCVLHHADFWITKDPELMKEKGIFVVVLSNVSMFWAYRTALQSEEHHREHLRKMGDLGG